jgi:hypothetical protein
MKENKKTHKGKTKGTYSEERYSIWLIRNPNLNKKTI